MSTPSEPRKKLVFGPPITDIESVIPDKMFFLNTDPGYDFIGFIKAKPTIVKMGTITGAKNKNGKNILTNHYEIETNEGHKYSLYQNNPGDEIHVSDKTGSYDGSLVIGTREVIGGRRRRTNKVRRNYRRFSRRN